jgi:hypothetical protein
MVRKTLTILGHSNAAGQAGWVEMAGNATYVLPYRPNDPQGWIWKNIYVFTSAHGWAGTDGTPPTFTVDQGEWLEMTAHNPVSPADPHPHPSPYRYPNFVGWPAPTWRYDAGYDPTIFRGTGAIAGIELPLMCRLSNYWVGDIGLVKLACPGSAFMRYDPGAATEILWEIPAGVPTPESYANPSFGYYAWYTPGDTFDWNPGTNRLYSRWLTKCIAAKEADPEMSIEVALVWMGDNDSFRERERVENIEEYMREFIARLRSDLVAHNLTELPKDQIRIVLMGVYSAYDGQFVGSGSPLGNPEFINAAYQRIANDDPYIRFVPTYDYDVWEIDDGHFSSTGYLQAAADVFEAIVDMDTEPYQALAADDRLTVAEMKRRVRLYYSRGKVSTDIGDELLLMHLNGSMHHCLHQCGDMAYWLRRRAPFLLEGGGTGNPITLPRQVHRLLKIESITDATYPIQYEMLGHAEGGKLQIVMPRNTTGTYNLHYIRMPRDLTRDTELVPFPQILVEWIVVETCYRLARAAAAPLQIASFQAEVTRLREDVLKNLAQTQRAKRDRLHTQRRLPNPLRRNRNWRWDSS